jgi:monoamine oxidase
VADLLRERAASLGGPAVLEPVVRYLEGFHAADLSLLGTRSLAENEAAGDEDGEDIQRIQEGYGALVRRLAERSEPDRCEIRLGCEVTGIHWRAGEARVRLRSAGGSAELTARRAVLTLPLPILRQFLDDRGRGLHPDPPGWRAALECLHMGAAHRVVLGFESRWWTAAGTDGPSFVHGSGAEAFPIWWTALPSRQPVITGWIGGPRAQAMAGQGEATMLRSALESLASVFGRDAGDLRSRLRVAYIHDWSSDPFSGGAYSYGGVGAIEARAALARPVDHTLFLAGEAVADRGRNGTVHGALATGQRAAAAVLAEP